MCARGEPLDTNDDDDGSQVEGISYGHCTTEIQQANKQRKQMLKTLSPDFCLTETAEVHYQSLTNDTYHGISPPNEPQMKIRVATTINFLVIQNNSYLTISRDLQSKM